MNSIVNLNRMPAAVALKLLFERMFAHIWKVEPRIVIDEEVLECLRELRDTIAEGGKTWLSEGAYTQLFHAVVEGQIGTRDVEKVSLRLLTWYGEIGDVFFDSGDRVIALGTAIMLLAAAEDDGARSVLWREGEAEDVVHVTLGGTRSLGFPGSVGLKAKYRARHAAPSPSDDPNAFRHRLPTGGGRPSSMYVMSDLASATNRRPLQPLI